MHPQPAPLSRRYRWLVSVFIILFLSPNIAALLVPFESWPYTNAPMFADYVGEGTRLYTIRFIGLDGSGLETRLDPSHAGQRSIEIYRHFFKAVYGAQAPRSAFRIRGVDSRDAFERRASRFFEAYLRACARYGMYRSVVRVRLELHPVDERAPAIVLGTYTRASERFVHTYSAPDEDKAL